MSKYEITRDGVLLKVWTLYDRDTSNFIFGSILFDLIGIEELSDRIDTRVCIIWKTIIDQHMTLPHSIVIELERNKIQYGEHIIEIADNRTSKETVEDVIRMIRRS